MTDAMIVSVENEPRLINETGIERCIADLVEPIIIVMGFNLVKVTFCKLNLQILAKRNDGTMTLEDCEHLSRAISPVLDVEDLIKEPYNLEVSSPGIDRLMVRKSDFIRWKGHIIKCETLVMIENRRRFLGKIVKVSDTDFMLERDLVSEDDTIFHISFPFSVLSMARLVITDELIRNALDADKHPLKRRGSKEGLNSADRCA